MDATFTLWEQVGTLAAARTREPQLRYRITFADGSVGSRHYDEPLRIGQRIDGTGSSSHVISSIEREPAHGGLGRANAVPVVF